MAEPSLVFWINGKARMEEEISKIGNKFDKELQDLNKKLSSFHIKKIRNKEYWYQVSENGKWLYCGAVKKTDPQIQILKEISRVEQNKKIEVEKVRSSIIKEIGSHLIIDYNHYQPNNDEIVGVYEILKTVKEAISGKA